MAAPSSVCDSEMLHSWISVGAGRLSSRLSGAALGDLVGDGLAQPAEVPAHTHEPNTLSDRKTCRLAPAKISPFSSPKCSQFEAVWHQVPNQTLDHRVPHDLRESANRVTSYRPLSSPNFSTRGCTVVANLHTKGEQQGAAAPTPPTILDRRHRAVVALRLRVQKSPHAQGGWYR